MEKISISGTPIAVSETRRRRTKFFLITKGSSYVNCIFNGNTEDTLRLQKLEADNQVITITCTNKSDITTRNGKKYTVYYPSSITYKDSCTHKLKAQ